MLKESIEVFKEMWSRDKDALLLDDYIPADGTYLIVGADGSCKEVIEVRLDKRTYSIDRSSGNFQKVCFYDYYSKLISINKPIDTEKQIHTNNYLSFSVKKDTIVSGKLTEAIIDEYYQILENPLKKYKKPNTADIYKKFEKEYGQPDIEKLERNKSWIKKHIYTLEQFHINMQNKDYVKIFFEDTDENYIIEAERYLIPNIYNSNDYNVEIEGKVYGLPNNNLGMNKKKPYLSIKTRKLPASYLLDKDEVMIQQKFFDYLLNFASSGKYNIFIDLDRRKIKALNSDEMPDISFSGLFLRVQKGTELEIHYQDQIPIYRSNLPKRFNYKNILEVETEKYLTKAGLHRSYSKKQEFQALLNEVLFSKCLINNYFTPIDKLSLNNGYLKDCLLMSRDAVFNWIYKDDDYNLSKILQIISNKLVKGSIVDGYYIKAQRQFNLQCSLLEYFGGENMGAVLNETKDKLKNALQSNTTLELSTDEEYYFAVGQLVKYFISLNKTKKKMQSLANPFFNMKTNKLLKDKLRQYYLKYNHEIYHKLKSFNNLYAMVLNYEPKALDINHNLIIAGYLNSSLLFENKKDENAEGIADE